ncbi:MAG: helix-turn-helix domain-containing protein, partial [Lacticaseibacillus paracasei]
ADISIFLPFMAGWLKLFECAESEAAPLFDQTLTLYHRLGMQHHEAVWQDVRRSEIAHYKKNEPSDFFVFDGI